MDAIITHLKTWNPNGNYELKHAQLASCLQELDAKVWTEDKIASLLKNSPDPMTIEMIGDLLNTTAVDAFLSKVKTWNPNGDGKLKHDQVVVLLQKIDPSYWSDDKIKLLLANLPDPVLIETFASSLFPSGQPPELAFRNVPDAVVVKVAESRGMKVEYAEKTMGMERGGVNLSLCKKLAPEEEERIRAVFNSYDKDGSGKLDLQELTAMCKELGGKITQAQAELAMKQLDKCGDGKCDFQEFCMFWTSKPSLGGYDEVSLQLLKGGLATRAAAMKVKSKIAGKAGKKIPEGKSLCNSSFVISPNMGPFEPKMTAKFSVTKGGDPNSKSPVFNLQLLATDEKAAASTKAVICEALDWGMAEVAAEIGEEVPVTVTAEEEGKYVNIKVSFADAMVAEMFNDEEFTTLLGVVEQSYEYYETSLEWSNDFADVVENPDKIPFEYLGGLKFKGEAMIEYGYLSMLAESGDEEWVAEVMKLAFETWAGMGFDVKVGYFAQHLKTVARELKAMDMGIPTLQSVRNDIKKEREMAGDDAYDEKSKKALGLLSKVLKEFSANVESIASLSFEGLGSTQAKITYEKARPWLIAQYILQPILEMDVDAKDVPKPVGTTSLVKDVPDEEKARIREIFNKYDKDNSGCIDLKEFEGMVRELGGKITTEEAQQAITQLDKDGSFTINWDEFMTWWSSQPGCGGYSSVALAFLKMKMAGWNTLMKGKKALVRNTMPVTEESETSYSNAFTIAPNMDYTAGPMSSTVNFAQELSASSAPPSITVRLIANSGEDAGKCVATMTEQYAQFAEGLPLEVTFEQEDAEVVVKISAPAEVADAMMSSAEPEMLDTLATMVQTFLNSSMTINYGSSFEDWLEKPDEPLPELLKGMQFSFRTGVSAAGRQMLSAMSIPGLQNIFRPLVRSFAGLSIESTMGYNPTKVSELITKLMAMAGLPPTLSLSSAQEMVTAMFPEELQMFLPPVLAICQSLKGIKSINVTGFVPKPDAEGSKLDLAISFEKFSVFSLAYYFLKPLAPPEA
mmetsp:Transcript_6087/g.10940  ORF Transcript_6087/g.10940 Transcript_6087/m.10940 type:complete len:1022 (+) Transcript_6087:78-3143(+)